VKSAIHVKAYGTLKLLSHLHFLSLPASHTVGYKRIDLLPLSYYHSQGVLRLAVCSIPGIASWEPHALLLNPLFKLLGLIVQGEVCDLLFFTTSEVQYTVKYFKAGLV